MYSTIIQYIRRSIEQKKTSFYIFSIEDLKFFNDCIEDFDVLGVDTEFDWRSTYFPQLSLLQISTSRHLFILDSLQLDLKNVIKPIFESDSHLKIFHSVRSDATVLNKCLNIKTKNVFDIQQAEKLINGEDIKSYGKLVSNYFGIDLDKNETNSNWLKRPLTKSQLNYAYQDINFLIKIYKIQKKILIKKSLLKDALTASKKEANEGNKNFLESRLEKKIKIGDREKKIFIWREEIAQDLNIPPGFIFKDKSLIKLSKIESKDPNFKKKVMTYLGDTIFVEKFIKNFL